MIYDLIANIAIFDEQEKSDITNTLAWIENGAPIFRIQKPDTE